MRKKSFDVIASICFASSMLLLCGIICGGVRQRHSFPVQPTRRYGLPNSDYIVESKVYSNNCYEISFSSATKNEYKDELLLRKDAIGRFAVSQLEPFIIYVDTQFELFPSTDTGTIHFANDIFNQSDINNVSYFLFDAMSENEIEAYRIQYAMDESFPGTLSSGGINGIDAHAVASILDPSGSPAYPVVVLYSEDIKTKNMIKK